MFERMKKALVTSFVGAIGLGWLFAQGISHFTGIFSTPIAAWSVGAEFRAITGRSKTAMDFVIQGAVPELARCVSLLLVGYFLLRWLYFTPVPETAESKPEQ